MQLNPMVSPTPPSRSTLKVRPNRGLRLLALLITIGLGDPLSLTAAGSVHADRGMVVAESGPAAEVGVAVRRAGGNAMDAAVATAFALAVTHPAAGNVGGGGFLVYRSHEGQAVAYDFRETAPAKAHARMFLRDGEYSEKLHHRGHGSVGVPGTVAGLHLAWQDHGRLPWNRLVDPAVALAEDGFILSESLASSLSNALKRLAISPAAIQQFTRDGHAYRPGERLRQPDLARTLRLISRNGPEGFYSGEVARLLEQEMRRNGGLLTAADLLNYQAKRRSPVRARFGNDEILSMPPPSSGGVVLALMLHVLDPYPLRESGASSARTVHWMAEAMRRGFAQRALHLGDPDFNPNLPVERLISPEFADALRDTIGNQRASRSDPARFDWPAESPQTTHLSVMDADRNAVALTTTLEESYGSGIIAPGTGFLLNNEMGDFNAAPGLTTTNGWIGTEPNLAAPGKRMLSSMTPTIVVRENRPFLVLGSPGGRTIINTVLQVILNVLEHDMDLATAVAAPRFHHQWLPDEIVYEKGAFSPETRQALALQGHLFRENESVQGAVMAIRWNGPGTALEGMADPRAADAAAVGW